MHIFFRENKAQGPLWLVRVRSRSQETPTWWKEFCLLSIIVITVSLSVTPRSVSTDMVLVHVPEPMYGPRILRKSWTCFQEHILAKYFDLASCHLQDISIFIVIFFYQWTGKSRPLALMLAVPDLRGQCGTILTSKTVFLPLKHVERFQIGHRYPIG